MQLTYQCGIFSRRKLKILDNMNELEGHGQLAYAPFFVK